MYSVVVDNGNTSASPFRRGRGECALHLAVDTTWGVRGLSLSDENKSYGNREFQKERLKEQRYG